MSIGHRFFLTVSLPVSACLIALSAGLYFVSRQELENEYEKRLLARAEQVRLLVADSVELTKSDLTILMTNELLDQYFMYGNAGELDYQEDVRASLEENFLRAGKAKPRYASIRLFTIAGEGIVNVVNRKGTYRYPDPGSMEWFKTTADLKNSEVHVSHVHPCPEHQAPALYVSQLFYYWGEPAAIACIHLHMQDYFAAILKETGQPEGGQIFLVGEGGEIVAHPDPARLAQKIEDPAVIQDLLAGKEKIHIKDNLSGAIPVKMVYFPLGVRGAVGVILQPLAEIKTLSRKLEQRLLGIGSLTAALLLVSVYFSIKAVTRPLSSLEKATRKIAGGDLEARVGIVRNDEIGRLSISFDNMADNLQRSQHELRQALAEVRKLSGFLPICASCKKIRDDKGYWNQIESYISQHSEAQFSHGICPDCLRNLYPDLSDKLLAADNKEVTAEKAERNCIVKINLLRPGL